MSFRGGAVASAKRRFPSYRFSIWWEAIVLLVSCRQRFKKARLALLSGSLNDHRSLIVNDGSSQTDRKAGGISTKSLAPEQLTYSVKEVAELLGVTDKTVYRLLARRLLRSLKPLRHHRIPKTELERFLQENL